MAPIGTAVGGPQICSVGGEEVAPKVAEILQNNAANVSNNVNNIPDIS